MVVQRPIEIDMSRVASDASQIPPAQQRIIIQQRDGQQRQTMPVMGIPPS